MQETREVWNEASRQSVVTPGVNHNARRKTYHSREPKNAAGLLKSVAAGIPRPTVKKRGRLQSLQTSLPRSFPATLSLADVVFAGGVVVVSGGFVVALRTNVGVVAHGELSATIHLGAPSHPESVEAG